MSNAPLPPIPISAPSIPPPSDSLISPTELALEMESLLSLRRRSLSSNPASSDLIDPDLPPSLSPTPSNVVGVTGNEGGFRRSNSRGGTSGSVVGGSTGGGGAGATTGVVRDHEGYFSTLSSLSNPDTTQSSSPSIIPPPLSSSSSTPIPQNFWLPASLHPELAPQEFKAFIKDQTLVRQRSLKASTNGGMEETALSVGTGGDETGTTLEKALSLRRAKSRGGFPSRKKSMLRREYKGEGGEEGAGSSGVPESIPEDDRENSPPPTDPSSSSHLNLPSSSLERSTSSPTRNPSLRLNPLSDPEMDSSSHAPFRMGSLNSKRGGMSALSQLTLKDLQNLEKIAAGGEIEGAVGGAGVGGKGAGLRRSLSLNPVDLAEAAAAVQILNSQSQTPSPSIISPISTDTDASTINSPSAASPTDPTSPTSDGDLSPQILRRGARTRIRKPHLSGDGGGVRFSNTRRRGRGGSIEGGEEKDVSEDGHSSFMDRDFGSEEGGGELLAEKGKEKEVESVEEVRHEPVVTEDSQRVRKESFGADSILDSYRDSFIASDKSSLVDGNNRTSLVDEYGNEKEEEMLETVLATDANNNTTTMPISENLKEVIQSVSEHILIQQQQQHLQLQQHLQQQSAVQHPDVNVNIIPPTPTVTNITGFNFEMVEPGHVSSDQPEPPYLPPTQQQAAEPKLIAPQPQVPSKRPSLIPSSAKSSKRPSPTSSNDQLSSRTPSPQTPPNIPSRPASPTPSVKAKKSGWSRLFGGGKDKDKDKDRRERDDDDNVSMISVDMDDREGSSGGKKGKGKKNKKEKEMADVVNEAKRKEALNHQQHNQPRINEKAEVEKHEKHEEHKKPEKPVKEKEAGFFTSLFGGGKKKHEDPPQHPSNPAPPPANLPLAVAVSPTASGMLTKDGVYLNFYRLPIHVERAVYRLSHIKLANPRRALAEQVLISNLMFWYLSVINKPQGGGRTQIGNGGNGWPEGKSPSYHPGASVPRMDDRPEGGGMDGPPGGGGNGGGMDGHQPVPNHSQSPHPQSFEAQPQQVQQQSQPPMPQSAPQPSVQSQHPQRQPPPPPPNQEKNSQKKSGLTKRPPQNQGRPAEMAIKPPQYEKQNRVIDQEYSQQHQHAFQQQQQQSSQNRPVSMPLNSTNSAVPSSNNVGDRTSAPSLMNYSYSQPRSENSNGNNDSQSSSSSRGNRPIIVQKLHSSSGFEVMTRPPKSSPPELSGINEMSKINPSVGSFGSETYENVDNIISSYSASPPKNVNPDIREAPIKISESSNLEGLGVSAAPLSSSSPNQRSKRGASLRASLEDPTVAKSQSQPNLPLTSVTKITDASPSITKNKSSIEPNADRDRKPSGKFIGLDSVDELGRSKAKDGGKKSPKVQDMNGIGLGAKSGYR